jgi:hypothetical protein
LSKIGIAEIDLILIDVQVTDEQKAVIVAEKEKLINDNHNLKVSFIYKIIPNHKIQKLDQWLGYGLISLKNLTNFLGSSSTHQQEES